MFWTQRARSDSSPRPVVLFGHSYLQSTLGVYRSNGRVLAAIDGGPQRPN